MGVMEGRDGRHIIKKFKDLFAPLLVINWQVWPVAQVSLLATPCWSANETVPTILAHQFPFHASSLPGPVSVHLRCLLDSLSVNRKLKVGAIFVLSPLPPSYHVLSLLQRGTKARRGRCYGPHLALKLRYLNRAYILASIDLSCDLPQRGLATIFILNHPSLFLLTLQ